MSWFVIIVTIIVFLFGFVILFGAPYLPTLNTQKEQALDLLDLKSGQTMLELGCGDGRVLRAAAARGLKCVGYELNPILVIIAVITTWRYRRQVKIIWGDYWQKQWPEAQGIFVFLLPKYMSKLDTKITQQFSKPVKLISFAFEIPSKKPTSKKNGLFLYRYN